MTFAGKEIYKKSQVKSASYREDHAKPQRERGRNPPGGQRTPRRSSHLSIETPFDILIQCSRATSHEHCAQKGVEEQENPPMRSG